MESPRCLYRRATWTTRRRLASTSFRSACRIASLHAAGEVLLLVGSQQGRAGDLVEVETQQLPVALSGPRRLGGARRRRLLLQQGLQGLAGALEVLVRVTQRSSSSPLSTAG